MGKYSVMSCIFEHFHSHLWSLTTSIDGSEKVADYTDLVRQSDGQLERQLVSGLFICGLQMITL